MTLLIFNKTDLHKVDKYTKLQDLGVKDLGTRSYNEIGRAHIVLICDQESFKVIKCRFPLMKPDNIYPIQMLGYIIYRCHTFDEQSFLVEEDWIMEMTRYMTPDRLQKLSILLEGEALRRA